MARVAALLALGSGIAFRLVAWAHHSSLWVDEAMLALNIGSRSLAELARPLDLLQMAPVLFLWLEKAAVAVGGISEGAFRFVPLVASIGALVLTRSVAARVLPPAAVALAVGLVAFSPTLIDYAVEVKPYSLDAAVALALVLLAMRALGTGDRRPDTRARPWPVAAAVLAPWISFTSVFVIATIGWLLLRDAHERQRATRLVATGMLWAASAFACVLGSRDRSVALLMKQDWSGAYVSPTVEGASHLVRESINMIRLAVMGATPQADPGAVEWLLAAFLGVVAAAGAVRLARYRQRSFVLIVGPMAVALVASLLKEYPYASRLWLFALPLVAILVATGVHAVFDRGAPRRSALLTLLASGVILLPAFRYSFYTRRHPELPGSHRPPVRSSAAAAARRRHLRRRALASGVAVLR